MLPEKHPTVANAHSQFEEVNSAFVKGGFYLFKNIYRLDTIFQLVKVFSEKGERTDNIIPGEIYIKNFQFTLSLVKGSAGVWKKAIKQNYQSVIIGSQKTTTMLNMKVTCCS